MTHSTILETEMFNKANCQQIKAASIKLKITLYIKTIYFLEEKKNKILMPNIGPLLFGKRMQLSPTSCQTFHVSKRCVRPHSWPVVKTKAHVFSTISCTVLSHCFMTSNFKFRYK